MRIDEIDGLPGPVDRERSQVIVVRQPLIFRIAIQECDLALGVVPTLEFS